jgi:hypothetical protein
MIVNVFGSMGSGKTTLVRKFLALYEHEKWPQLGGYVVSAQQQRFFVAGTYERVSGGVEGMKVKDIRTIVASAHQLGYHAIYEGVMASYGFGPCAEFHRAVAPGDSLFAFLHPPAEVCVARVLERRKARGADTVGFDPSRHVLVHHAYVGRQIERARAQREPHVVLDWQRPLDQLVEQLVRLFPKAPRRRQKAA